MAVRIALGDNVRPDYRAIPRAVYTDPEVAGVGLQLEEARAAGHDAFEAVANLADTAKGQAAEATGHVTLVVDRGMRTLLGAFIAAPAASEAIHEAVLAIRTRTTLDILADTIHAFPTLARVMGDLFAEVVADLCGLVAPAGATQTTPWATGSSATARSRLSRASGGARQQGGDPDPDDGPS
jgi:hypothetical protein